MTEDGKKVALITGVTGQDGSYLAELLLAKGYQVHGLKRHSSSYNIGRIQHVYQDPHIVGRVFNLWYGDITDSSSVVQILAAVRPDEIYNLAAQSHVRISFEIPEQTAVVNALGTLRILEAIRQLNLPCKFYQASTSEMFGSSPPPQNESTPFNPRSAYAISKLFAHHMVVNYREAYGMFACSGILFNHESPRRGDTFVTRKVTEAIAKIVAKKQKKVYVGNLEAKRDWGYAPEYVEVMWKMMQQDKPDDYVIATGEAHSVREFVEEAFRLVGLDWEQYAEVDPWYFRPTEVEHLIGDATKAKEKFGWHPKVTFKDLIQIMMIEDLKSAGIDPQKFGLPLRHPLAFSFHKDRL